MCVTCFFCVWLQALLGVLLLLLIHSLVSTASGHGAARSSPLGLVFRPGAPTVVTCQLPAQHGLLLWLTLFSGAENLLLDAHARVYVADLPPKYNLYIMAQEGCEDGIFLRNFLSNPLGPLLNASLDSALYR